MLNITIIVTFYNYNYQEYIYWYQLYKRNKDKIIFNWIINNPKISANFADIDEKDLFIADINTCKFDSVYKHINSNVIKTDYIKIVDPDDKISIENLLKFKSLERGILYQIPFFLIDSDSKNDTDESKVMMKNSIWTAQSILPNIKIRDDIRNIPKNLNMNEDYLIGLLMLISGASLIFDKDAKPITYYKFMSGISGNNFVDDYKNLTSNINDFFKIINMIFTNKIDVPVLNFPWTSLKVNRADIKRMIKIVGLNKKIKLLYMLARIHFIFLRYKKKYKDFNYINNLVSTK